MMVSWVRGSFGTVDGNIDIDGTNLKTLKTSVKMPIADIDTDNEKRDEHLKGADFFDAAQFPAMTFVSTGVKKEKGTEGFALLGNLTIHGVTKEVSLETTGFMPPQKDPWGNTKSGISAEVTINRQDYGLSWSKALETGGVVVGDEVHIVLDLELTLQADAKKGAEKADDEKATEKTAAEKKADKKAADKKAASKKKSTKSRTGK